LIKGWVLPGLFYYKEEIMNKNDLVFINLDRKRYLRFGHKALKTLTALTDMDITNMDMSNFSLEDLEKVLYSGLLSDARENGEILKLEEMEDLLDLADSFKEIMEKLQEAFEKSFGEAPKGEEKN
jgi:hypothetical protein